MTTLLRRLTAVGTRTRAAVTLVAVVLASGVAGCRGAGRTAPAPRPGTPPPAVVPGDTPRTPTRADTTTPPADSATAALERAARERITRDSVVRDSLIRADSLAKAALAAKLAADKAAAAARKANAPTSRPCVMDFSESPPETRLLFSQVAEGVSNAFIGGGFVGHCQGENNRLRADSAEQFQAAGIVNLYGNVVFEEPDKVQITAAHATYFTREGRLYADGNVVATQLATGSTFVGPSIEYFRAMPGRPQARMVAPSRSTATLIERDSTGRQMPPTRVTANRFEDTGDSLLLAWGDVQIDREKINGRSDSAAFDKRSETARLVRSARIVNTDTAQSFTLVGDSIDLYTKQRRLERVVALHKGRATSRDLELTAERIDVRLKAQQLEEAFAFGPGRARATTPQQDVTADSLRIRLADKLVREVRAVGTAIAVGTPDTLKIRTKDKDVLRGDSVFAFFDSTAVTSAPAAPGTPVTAGAIPAAPAPATADSARTPRIREIRALGNASSLFHVATSKGLAGPPAINYVRGTRIYVNFDTGAVRDVRVDSAASGVYLEPAPDSLADSTARATRARTDTGAAGGRGRPPAGSPPAGSPPRRPPADVPLAPFAGAALVTVSFRLRRRP